MDREESLRRRRKEKRNKDAEYAANTGRRYGVAAMAVMFAVLSFFNLYYGLRNDALFAQFFTYLGMESYGLYKAGGQKIRLAGGAAGFLAGVFYCISYVVRAV